MRAESRLAFQITGGLSQSDAVLGRVFGMADSAKPQNVAEPVGWGKRKAIGRD